MTALAVTEPSEPVGPMTRTCSPTERSDSELTVTCSTVVLDEVVTVWWSRPPR